jgi:ribosomal protein L12E/L44/L45/RPP1/RPP2
MLERENILNELHAISPLVASVPRVNVYKVDENYFDGIRAELQARIIASNFMTPQNYFDVPEGYFENLPINILAKIKTQENNPVFTELKVLSPTIAGIGNRNVYTVPQGYFENLVLPINVSAKVVKMGSRSIFKYAAAAVIVGLLGFGTMKFIANTKANNETRDLVKEANKILETNSFDATLASVSDKDIEKYLSQNGEDINAAMVAASMDDDNTALPEADDYLTDDNTLDNFLNDNNLKN